MNIFNQIDPIVEHINKAKLQYDRFGRERVLAFVLQSSEFDSTINLRRIGLKQWQKEKISDTTNRIQKIQFAYNTLHIPEISRVLRTLQPAQECRNQGATKEANCLAGISCSSTASLGEFFDILITLQNPPPENWQAGCLSIKGWGKKGVLILSSLLEKNGIDPNISRAEVTYFHKKAVLSTASNL